MIFNYIDGYYFIISLCIGIFFVYILSYQPQIIMRYPTPENEDTLTYKDRNDVCYKYKSEEVKCSNGEKDIMLQNNDNENVYDKILRVFK